MVRTRGRGSQSEGWTRPTTSVGGADAPVGGVDAGEAVSFPWEPFDVSLSVSYNHHVTLRLWQGEVRLCYNFFLCLCCT